MQVSLVCTDHRGGVSRTTEDRLNRQNANSPSTGTRSKFRAVAMVARSLGQLSVQSVPSSSEQSIKTGMKYRYGMSKLVTGNYKFGPKSFRHLCKVFIGILNCRICHLLLKYILSNGHEILWHRSQYIIKKTAHFFTYLFYASLSSLLSLVRTAKPHLLRIDYCLQDDKHAA